MTVRPRRASPQGSALGLFLFIAGIDDLNKCLPQGTGSPEWSETLLRWKLARTNRNYNSPINYMKRALNDFYKNSRENI